MDKKAQISPVFKYIFVAIAGGIILTFFFFFARTEISNQETLNSAILTRTLENAFSAFSISKNADKTINLGIETEIFFNRNNICNTLSVKDSSPARIKDPIFSPSILKGNELDIWTQKYKYPFEITNFFYLSNDNTKYILIGDNILVEELIGILKSNGDCCRNTEFIPKRFDVESRTSITQSDLAQISPRYDIVKVVYINPPQEAPINPIGNVIVHVIHPVNCLEQDNAHGCKGRIEFGDNQNSIFLSKSMLYSAIFSDGYDNYECGLKKTFERFNVIINLYQDKLSLMSQLSTTCSKYLIMDDALKDIRSKVTSDLNNLQSLGSADVDAYNRGKNRLLEVNKDLIGDKDCEALF